MVGRSGTDAWCKSYDLGTIPRSVQQKKFSDVVRSSKVEEFVSLVQGKMTVTEYAQVFNRLARFAPKFIPTDRSR